MILTRIALTAALGFAWSLHDHSETFADLSMRVHSVVDVADEDNNRLQKAGVAFGWWLQEASDWLSDQGFRLEKWLSEQIEDSGYEIDEITAPLEGRAAFVFQSAL